MFKLISSIVTFVTLAAVSAFAQPSVTLKGGYVEKTIELGRVVNEHGVYVAGADATWQSFHFAAAVESDGSINGMSLARTDLLAGYKFFSTLVDVEVGDQMFFKQNAGKYDATPHNRPYAKLSKGLLSFTGQYDVQSDAVNGQIDLAKAFKVGFISVKPDVYIGYTNAYSWLNNLPKNVKKLKFNETYYGTRVIASWKMLYAGVDVIRVGSNSKNTIGFEAGLTHKL